MRVSLAVQMDGKVILSFGIRPDPDNGRKVLLFVSLPVDKNNKSYYNIFIIILKMRDVYDEI